MKRTYEKPTAEELSFDIVEYIMGDDVGGTSLGGDLYETAPFGLDEYDPYGYGDPVDEGFDYGAFSGAFKDE